MGEADLKREELRDIPEFENYSITKEGRVWSKPRPALKGKIGRRGFPGRWLTIQTFQGYPIVGLWKDNRGYRIYIHDLLLGAFIGLRPKGAVCRHLNGKRLDNRLANLTWGTYKENTQDAIYHGTAHCIQKSWNRSGENNGRHKVTREIVHVMRYLREIARFSVSDLRWQFGVGKTTVKDICGYKTWRNII